MLPPVSSDFCTSLYIRLRIMSPREYESNSALQHITTFVPITCSGGPGSNKSALCQKAVRQAPGWVHFSVGRLLRATAETTDPRQGNDSQLVRQAISSGEMVPEVSYVYRVLIELTLLCLNFNTPFWE